MERKTEAQDVPVDGLRREFLGRARLDGVDPTCRYVAVSTLRRLLPAVQLAAAGWLVSPIYGIQVGMLVVVGDGPGMGSLPWRFRKAA